MTELNSLQNTFQTDLITDGTASESVYAAQVMKNGNLQNVFDDMHQDVSECRTYCAHRHPSSDAERNILFTLQFITEVLANDFIEIRLQMQSTLASTTKAVNLEKSF